MSKLKLILKSANHAFLNKKGTEYNFDNIEFGMINLVAFMDGKRSLIEIPLHEYEKIEIVADEDAAKNARVGFMEFLTKRASGASMEPKETIIVTR